MRHSTDRPRGAAKWTRIRLISGWVKYPNEHDGRLIRHVVRSLENSSPQAAHAALGRLSTKGLELFDFVVREAGLNGLEDPLLGLYTQPEAIESSKR